MSVGGDHNQDDKSVSRKRSATDAELSTEEDRNSASNDTETRTVCVDMRIQELEEVHVALRRENAQLRHELDALSTENNNLRQFLESQQQAVQERNLALQLLLQQPGLIMQQQQYGPLLALPGAPVSLLNEDPNDPVNHPPSLHATSPIVQEQQSSQQQGTMLLFPPDIRQRYQNTHTVLLPGGATPPASDMAAAPPTHLTQEQVPMRTLSSRSLSSTVQATSRNALAILENKRALEQVQGELKEIYDVKSRLQDFRKQESDGS